MPFRRSLFLQLKHIENNMLNMEMPVWVEYTVADAFSGLAPILKQPAQWGAQINSL
jgi:hypothetical protein